MTKEQAKQIMEDSRNGRDDRKDRVDRLISDFSAEHFVAWLVHYKGLDPEVSENVQSNLDGLLRAHELRGRIWRGGFFACLISYFEWRKRERRDRDVDQASGCVVHGPTCPE